ncbi:MAG TPA: hypothetical protein VIJ20_07425 [Solirubrobacteraceae bacterium]
MTADSSIPSRRSPRARKHASRRIVPLVLLAFFAFAASAQAHDESVSTACAPATTGNTVTFVWSAFANPPGTGNGGENTPQWKIVYTPTGGSPVTINGSVTFPLDTYTLTVPVPSAAGALVASSSWTAAQTTDGNADSYSNNLTVPNCYASPAIATTASAGVAAGGTISDSATLSGGRTPTGTITFNLYAASDTTCSNSLSTGTATVNGNGTYTSPAVTESTAGSYQWVASYGGDANNTAIAEACNEPSEQVVVTPPPSPPPPPPIIQATPLIVTKASPGVLVGGTISDQATLSGGNAPTGTITFNLYSISDKTCSHSLASGPPVTVINDGSYPSPVITETTPGTYQWVATYSGDANNASVTDGCGQAAEQVVVKPKPPPLAACPSKPKLLGVFAKVQKSFTARLTSVGVKSVTFYLDGHKLKTLNGPKTSFFFLSVNLKHVHYGHHMLLAKVKSTDTARACNTSIEHGFVLAKKPTHYTPTG